MSLHRDVRLRIANVPEILFQTLLILMRFSWADHVAIIVQMSHSIGKSAFSLDSLASC
jgi:hypothetical protein